MHYNIFSIFIFVILTLLLGSYVSSSADVIPVNDRTEEVRDAIVTSTGLNSADEVTETHLAAITSLNLRNEGITELKSGDFSGLTGLTDLNLYNNEMSSLPDGIFEGLTALTTLRLGSNSVDPMPISVSLEKVGSDQVKVVVPTGAPFDIVVPVSAINGSLVDDATTLTVTKGCTASGAVTISRTENTTDAVTANIGTLPSLPQNHYGYTLSKSDDLPLEVISAISTPVTPTPDPTPPAEIDENSAPVFSDGTIAIRSVLENTRAGMNIGSPVSATDADNDTLTYSLSGVNVDSFDIDTVTGQLKTKAALDYETKRVYVVTITVSDTELTDIITVIIRIVDVVETTLVSTSLTVSHRTDEVRDAIVAAAGVSTADDVTDTHLETITNLDLRSKSITALKTGDFSGLSGLTNLNLHGNMLSSLPVGIFVGLTSLTSLRLGGNTVTPMPLTVALQQVTDNQYRVIIPAGAPFDVVLPLNDAGVTSITIAKGSMQSAAFTGTTDVSLGSLPTLPVNHYGYILTQSTVCNRTTEVSDAITAAVPGVTDCRNVTDVHLATITALDLSSESISSLNSEDLSGLMSLTMLNLSDNQLSSLPDGIFTGLTILSTLNLSGNNVDPIPLSVILQKVGIDQFKVSVPTAAPFTMMLPISISNGSISGDIEMVTIKAGTMISSTLTVIRTPNTFSNVTVDINTLPSLPTGHTGYTLTKSNAIPLEIFSEISVAPEFSEGPTTTRTVAENTTAGENIGDAISATDENDDELTYTLSGTDAASFDIDETTGQLKTKVSIDYETKNVYSVLIAVSDGSLSDTIDVTINVTDVEENRAPVFTEGSSATRAVAENTGSGVDIGDPVSATDADEDTLIYSLSGTDSASFNIDTSSGQLRTLASLDYENRSTYSVTITVSDSNLIDTIDVTVNITDVDESTTSEETVETKDDTPPNTAPEFTEGETTTRSVGENTGSGVNIGEPVSATDADKDTLTYTLGGADAASFSINSTNGQLRTSDPLDYETKSSYSVTITVSDDNGGSDTISVTISVADVDESPANTTPEFTEGTSTTRSVAENTGSGVNIGDPVSATDVDDDDLTYSLGGTDAGSFSIDSTTGQLRTSASLDYETTFSYSVTISVSDGAGGSDSITVAIIVTDVDETPVNNPPEFTDNDPTSRAIAENTGTGVNIGDAVSATDVDGDILTYSLSGPDAVSFSIDSTTGQLRTSASLDYETKSSYSVTISVSDGNGGSDSITVTIGVTDVDETPVNNPPEFTDADPATRTIAENTDAGVNIGDPVAATDADDDTLVYSLSGTDASVFTIDASTGQLKTDAALDFESDSSYEIIVNVSDNNGGGDSITITITLTDVNEAPTFPSVSTTRTIAENVAAGINIGSAVSAIDPDGDDLSYTLSGTDAASFDIESSTGQLKSKSSLDFETNSTYAVIVAVSDGNLSDTIAVTISVRDLDEAPSNVAPVFAQELTTRTIAENSSADTNIGTPVSATDADSATLVYLLSGTDASSFSIDEDIGQLKTSAALNFEERTTYTVTVTVSDGSLTDTITVTINITNVNEAPEFDSETASVNVDENTAAATNIESAFTAIDPDAGDTLTYSLEGTDAASFDIVSTSGQLQTKASLDFEDKSTYSVNVKASDSDGLSDTIAVTVNVQDVDENRAPVFTDGTETERSVDENTGAGVDIGDPVAATDVDDDTLTYSLGGTDSAAFDIDSTSGQLRTKAALDYETKDTYSVIVSVSDYEGGDASINVTIEVNDVHENRSPVFTEGTEADRSVDENTGSGVDIGAAVSATDADDDTLTYSLGGTDGASFDIDSTTGQLRTKDALDYEDKDSYSVIVSVSDNSGGNASVTVTIEVNDVHENRAPIFTEGTEADRSVDENTGSGVDIGAAVSATDADDDTLTYSLGGTDSTSFDIDSTTGQLRTKAALDYETKDSYSVIVSVSDNSGGNASISVTIEVNDVAEAPKFTNSTITLSVEENTAAGTNIGSPIPAATDDDGDNISYSLGGTDASHFAFNVNTRQLITNTVFDYDNDAKTSYTVTITATDDSASTLSSIVTVTVNVTKVETAPVFANDSVTLSIAENTATGTNIGSPITATDADGDTLTYTLEGVDAAAFNIDVSTGQLKTKDALDYENRSTYALIVRATDDSAVALSDTINVAINLTNVNDVPVFTEGTATTRAVPDNARVGASIGDPVSATDDDGDTLTYTLGGTDAAKFTLDTSTAQLQVKDVLDHEVDSTHVVTITATDTNGSSANIEVTITVEPPRITTPLADRSERVRETLLELVRALPDVDNDIELQDITLEHLHAITYFRLLHNPDFPPLKSGDLDDLPGLIELDMHLSRLTENNLPLDIFHGLTQLETLILRKNFFTSLPSGIFDGLTSLKTLNLTNNRITMLQSNIFDGLTSLEVLYVRANRYTTLPSNIFDGLTTLKSLYIGEDSFTTLQSGIFDELTALETLEVYNCQLRNLPDGIFDKLSSLERLDISGNRIANLPSDIFDELSTLETLELHNNRISTLPSGIFEELSALEKLDLAANRFTSFEADNFAGLPLLSVLNLSDNREVTSLPENLFENNPALESIGLTLLKISTLPSDIFDGLTSLESINMAYSPLRTLTSLPSDIFDGLSSLRTINLYENGLLSLPDGIFEGLQQLSNLHLGKQTSGDTFLGSFLMNISLISDEAGTFKARYHVGAVIETKVTVTVNNGTIDGETISDDGTYTITIEQGSVDSASFSVSRTAGTTAAVTVYISDLAAPNKPSGHTGYVLMNQTPRRNPLEIYAVNVGTAPTAVNMTSATPTITTLLTNFPNPFNPETWIPYQLSKSADVTLTIYNMRGGVVRELALGHQKAGYYTNRNRAAYWDGRNSIGEKVAAGVYFCTFKARDYTATRKMLIRK